MAKLTMIGMYSYAESIGVDLFDGLELPVELEKEVLVNNILLKCGDFEILYPNLEFLHPAITLWCKKWKRTIFKWNDALSITYNPLENYDRIEEYTDVFKNVGKGTIKGDNTINSNNSVTNKVSAYDSTELTEHDNTSNVGLNSSLSNTIDDRTDEGETKHNARLHGNIGVTTSQQMLESELNIAKWNVYDKITDLFLSEFIIPIY